MNNSIMILRFKNIKEMDSVGVMFLIILFFFTDESVGTDTNYRYSYRRIGVTFPKQ